MPRPYTLPEAADMLGVSRNTVYRWIRLGMIPVVQMGKRGKYLIPRESIDALVKLVPSNISERDKESVKN